MEERRKIDSTPPPHRPIIFYEGHTSAKNSVAKLGFQNGLSSNNRAPCSHGRVYVEKNLRRDKAKIGLPGFIEPACLIFR